MDARPWLVLFVALIGNFGFWLYCFNRVNATGIPRSATKRIEKVFILASFLIPLCLLLTEWEPILDWLRSAEWWPTAGATLFRMYGAWSVASFFVLGVGWLESRFWIIPPKHRLSQVVKRFDVDQSIDGGSAGDRFTAFLHSLPGNEIFRLEVTEKELLIPRSIPGIDGFKIGHISDLHFTGQYRPEHYQYVLQRFQELQPDWIVIAGDIIDKPKCIPWLRELLSPLAAPYGCSFVLGNHDRRITDIDAIARELVDFGFHDLGAQEQHFQTKTGVRVAASGNELPWLSRKDSEAVGFAVGSVSGVEGAELRVAVSHSPDQISWARNRKADLMLAGHTHGGQVRFPGIGPIVAPSRYGSKFASGVFFLPPTLMHVSRGVAGTHPLRWRCLPEVSLLTLRST
ncbi:MAG: metallophosphoesterase [Pirellulaceae bacterium]